MAKTLEADMVLLARRPRPPVVRRLPAVAGLLAAAACATPPVPGSVAGIPPDEPPPHGFRVPIESVPRSEFLEYAARLRFVQDPHFADEQPLIESTAAGRSTPVGPRARIEPELRSIRITPSGLEQGRVIARVISDGDYEPLGIRRGIQYVWFDRSGGRWRAAMVPANAAHPVRLLGASVSADRPHLTLAPSAIWFYDRGTAPAAIVQPGPAGQATCGRVCCAFCALLPPGACADVVTGMLRATEFGGAAGVPPMP